MEIYEGLINEAAELTVDRIQAEVWEIAWARMEDLIEDNGLEIEEEQMDELVTEAANRICFSLLTKGRQTL